MVRIQVRVCLNLYNIFSVADPDLCCWIRIFVAGSGYLLLDPDLCCWIRNFVAGSGSLLLDPDLGCRIRIFVAGSGSNIIQHDLNCTVILNRQVKAKLLGFRIV